MQLLVIVGIFAVLMVMRPFVGTDENPYLERAQALPSLGASRLDQYARAAWFAARAGATGAIDRSSMVLPAGFPDDPAHPLHAVVEGSYLYVWDASGTPATVSPAAILPDGDVTVDVGTAATDGLHFRNGQVAARPGWLAALGISGISVASNVYLATSTRVATYVVPVSEYGKPGKIVAAESAYEPSKAEIGYFLADWVNMVRSKSTDGVVLRNNWLNAYHFITGEAQQTLNGYARDNDPFAKLGQEARSVSVQAVLPRSKDTYQVTWTETRFERGAALPAERWTGLFTIKVNPPKNEQELRANPLGMFIKSFQWSREL